jgi:2-methylisocitrate lyase-like PEP mutase family enzyme
VSIEIEVDLTGAVQDYAMFSELGNAAVHAIVVAARANNLTWAQVYRALHQLAEQKEFSEAMDTMVRECVYSALGYDNSEQPFYGA